MHQGVSRLIAFIGGLALTSACAPPEHPRAPRHRIAKVHSFTEATAVYRVVSAPPYAFAATASGLDQWDLRSGRRIRRASDSQLFTARIADLAYDKQRSALWIVGSDGIARYDLQTDTVTHLELPARGAPLAALNSAVVAPGPDGGVYLGVSSSLYYADPSGAWTEAALDAPVSALYVDDRPQTVAGRAVYVGTESGLFAMHGSQAAAISCDLAAVRLLVRAPGGGVLAVGVADAGAQRVALINGEACSSFPSVAGDSVGSMS